MLMFNEDIKELVKKIIEEQIREFELNIDYHVVGTITYYNSTYFRSNKESITYNIDNTAISSIPSFILKDMYKDFHLLTAPFRTSGFYQREKNNNALIVFINDRNIPFFRDNDITRILHTTYHGIYHAIDDKQQKGNINLANFIDFATMLEYFLASNDQIYKLKY